eukprot:29505-Rhodomonas_salina.1
MPCTRGGAYRLAGLQIRHRNDTDRQEKSTEDDRHSSSQLQIAHDVVSALNISAFVANHSVLMHTEVLCFSSYFAVYDGELCTCFTGAAFGSDPVRRAILCKDLKSQTSTGVSVYAIVPV